MKVALLVYGVIPKDWKRKFFFLMMVYIILGVLEMLGVASIMPFVALLADPHVLEKSFVAELLVSSTGLHLSAVPVHWIGLVVLLLFLATNVLALVSTWLSVRFSNLLAVRLASDISRRFFERGYDFLRSRSPSLLANDTVREVEKIVSGGVLQLCLVVSRTFQVILIFLLLAIVSPVFSLVFSLLSVFSYVIFFQLLRGRLAVAGRNLIKASGNAANSADELYSGAKEIFVRGNLDYFLEDVKKWLFLRGEADEAARLFPLIPKYVVELTAFSAILSIPIYRSWIGDDYRSMVPFMALFAYAGYRLLPALQQVFAAISTLRFVGPTIEYFNEFLGNDNNLIINKTPVTTPFRRIELRNICYTYPGSNNPALDGLSFDINFGEKLAIVGLSGAGKSTVVDIILGLISPSEGQLIVDTKDYSEDGLVWPDGCIGYAPQNPMMLNKTVAENIAFGVKSDQIDIARCAVVAKMACIDNVIEMLPNGYLTSLGNDGVDLSGGECQRISIARALYHSPQVTVFDEPSSALDPLVSSQIVRNLCNQSVEVTTIVVTHDWDALEYFDKIVVLGEKGVLVAGAFSDVAEYLAMLKRN